MGSNAIGEHILFNCCELKSCSLLGGLSILSLFPNPLPLAFLYIPEDPFLQDSIPTFTHSFGKAAVEIRP